MVLFFPLVAILLLVHRVSLRQWMEWSLLAIPGFLLATAPVWIWNLSNDWASVRFQLHHGLGHQESWQPEWTLSYIGGQILLIFPTVLYAIFSHRPRRSHILLWAFGWGPIVFFAMTSFKGRTELNWPIVAFPTLLALAVVSQHKFRWAQVTLVVWGLALALVLSDLFWPWVPIANFKTQEPHAFRDLAAKVADIDPLYGRSYQMAAALSFDLHRQIYKLRGMNRRDFYDFRPESLPPAHSLFYVVTETGENLPEPWSHAILTRRSVTANYEVVEVQSP
jgi:hypothetical protein